MLDIKHSPKQVHMCTGERRTLHTDSIYHGLDLKIYEFKTAVYVTKETAMKFIIILSRTHDRKKKCDMSGGHDGRGILRGRMSANEIVPFFRRAN